MKNSTAIKLSISTTSLFFTAIIGWVWFTIILVMTFTPAHSVVCWEAGILGVLSYGIIAIRNFMENAHFENLNKNEE